MGSFNETCALSGLNIGPGTPVKQIFLVQNPYVVADNRFQHRGCYHYDQWFVRTPPINGVYADYGDMEFQEDAITGLITRLFEQDAVPLPFSFNQYHTGPVIPSLGINHLLSAAFQGRLLVMDTERHGNKKVNDDSLTWQKAHEVIKAAGLPLQMENRNGGYNAVQVMKNVVGVFYHNADYKNRDENLMKAIPLFAENYDTKVIYKFAGTEHQQEPIIMIVPKGAFENPAILHDTAKTLKKITTHPEMRGFGRRQLPCLSVMIHGEVWQAYCHVNGKGGKYEQGVPPLDVIHAQINKKMNERFERQASSSIFKFLGDSNLREHMMQLPFETTASSHLEEIDKDFPQKAELIQACAELARVEHIMAHLNHSWHIPPLGNQSGSWKLRTKLLSDIALISKTEMKKEQEEQE